MDSAFEQTLIEVWRQALVENASAVELDGTRYAVRRTPKRGLRQVDFIFEGEEIRGLEQNPETKSRGALRGECRGREGDPVRRMNGATNLSLSAFRKTLWLVRRILRQP